MCSVYWIHLDEHTDMFTEGYIGVTTKRVSYRFKEHVTKSKSGASLPVSKAIRKYGSRLIVDTLLVSTQEYCYQVEKKLRPVPKIGWNIAIGGEQSGTVGRQHSVETRAKISEALKGKPLSEQARKSISDAQLGSKHSEETKAKIAAALQGRKRGKYQPRLIKQTTA